jgi:1,5-anhydro-D-fructose reductase (1,5-anhydro-D-mannitol-forming)
MNTASPVGFAVVGSSGHGARVSAPTIERSSNTRLVGVLGSTPERGRVLADLHDCTGYVDWDDLAADDAVEAVWIAAGPNAAKPEYVKRCLEAGKHVLLDKPMATRYEDALEIEALAEASDRVFAVGYQHRFRDAHRWIHDAIADGIVGRPRILRIQGFVRFPYFEDMPERPEGWRASLVESGGWVVNDVGTHLVDLSMWFLGERARLIHSAPRNFRFTEATSEDTAALTMETEGGSLILIQVSNAMSSFPRTIEVHGLDGWLRADDTFNNPGSVLAHTGEVRKFDDGPAEDVYVVAVEDFARGVRGGPMKGATAADGAAAVEIVEAAANWPR